MGHYFQTKKGLRQGDPLSLILFNLVVDMLAILFERAKNSVDFKGVIPHLVEGGLSILQYADNTILFMEHNLDHAKNPKLVLSIFEQLSGLKIHFHKSKLYCYGAANRSMQTSSAANRVALLPNTLESLCIIVNCPIKIG